MIKHAITFMVLACFCQAADYSIIQREGRYCFLRPDGKTCLLLGLSHASGAWHGEGEGLAPEQKKERLATLKQDLRDLHFNSVGHVPELTGEFAYIHNGDRLPGSPGTVGGNGHAQLPPLRIASSHRGNSSSANATTRSPARRWRSLPRRGNSWM
jgi:hypothetical protein